MKYPALVPKHLCKTPCTICIHGEGLTEDGAPIQRLLEDIKGNYQDSAKTVYTDTGKRVEVQGKLLFNGDIAPVFPNISGGYVVVNGVKREIKEGAKRRNPDGTVNFTEVILL